MSEPVVRASRLGKCYRLYDRPGDRLRELLSPTRRPRHREFWALRELDLEVGRGECLGLIGRNGAGKSTTLKLLAGKLQPSEGSVGVRGRLSSILELGTGFQPHLTGRQNAFVNALFMGLAPWETDAHVAKVLDFAELTAHADQPLATYSSGMQARLAFAALTTLEPEVLILDEALATGDARFARKCNDYLRALCRSGCTTIIVSHDVQFVATVCDRVMWIDGGRKVDEGPAAHVVQRYLDASLGEADVTARPRHVVVRLEPEEPRDDVEFVLHALRWLDATGAAIAEHYVGDDPTFRALLDAAAAAAFTPAAARAGWGPAELTPENYLVRRCRPATTDGGAVHLTLPVPAPPAAVPAGLGVVLKHAAPCRAVLSLLVDGRWHELGRLGRAGAHEYEWEPEAFDLRGLLGATGAAPVAAAGDAP